MTGRTWCRSDAPISLLAPAARRRRSIRRRRASTRRTRQCWPRSRTRATTSTSRISTSRRTRRYVDALVAAGTGRPDLQLVVSLVEDHGQPLGGLRRNDVIHTLTQSWGDRFRIGTPLRRYLDPEPATFGGLGRMVLRKDAQPGDDVMVFGPAERLSRTAVLGVRRERAGLRRHGRPERRRHRPRPRWDPSTRPAGPDLAAGERPARAGSDRGKPGLGREAGQARPGQLRARGAGAGHLRAREADDRRRRLRRRRVDQLQPARHRARRRDQRLRDPAEPEARPGQPGAAAALPAVGRALRAAARARPVTARGPALVAAATSTARGIAAATGSRCSLAVGQRSPRGYDPRLRAARRVAARAGGGRRRRRPRPGRPLGLVRRPDDAKRPAR